MIEKKEDIIKVANSFKESKVLLTAVELDLFNCLGNKIKLPEEIAQLIGTDVRATDRLLSVLAGMGLLRKLKGKYYNTDLAKQYLVKGTKEYLGGLNHASHLWKTWSSLTESVKTGTSVANEDLSERDSEWQESFIEAMHSRGVKQANLLSYILDFSGVNTLLDIGGGSGAFTYAFLEQNPQLKGIIFDLPEIIPITQKYLDQTNLKERIEIMGGNYLEHKLPNNIDMIFMSAVIHINSPQENADLIKSCYNVLNDEGKIVIMDFIMKEDRVEPHHGALFSLNMLVGTKRGDTYTKVEITEWLKNSGFTEVEYKETSFGASLLIAHK